MNAEKITTYDDKLVFEKSGKIFTLIGGVLKEITEYIFDTTKSLVTKLNIDSMDEIRLETHARGKSLRDRNLIKNYFNKRALRASGLKRSKRTIFLPEISHEL